MIGGAPIGSHAIGARRFWSVTTGTTYNESITETVTAADALATVLTALGLVPAEAVTANDARAVNGTYNPSLSEAGTAGDTLGTVLTAQAVDAASVTAGDVVAGAQLLVDGLTESVSASDTPTSTWSGTATLTEAVNAADAIVDSLLGVAASVFAWFHKYRRRGRRP